MSSTVKVLVLKPDGTYAKRPASVMDKWIEERGTHHTHAMSRGDVFRKRRPIRFDSVASLFQAPIPGEPFDNSERQVLVCENDPELVHYHPSMSSDILLTSEVIQQTSRQEARQQEGMKVQQQEAMAQVSIGLMVISALFAVFISAIVVGGLLL